MEALRKALRCSSAITRCCSSFVSFPSFVQTSRQLSFLPRLLQPVTNNQTLLQQQVTAPAINQVRHFKVVGKPQRRCKDCYMVVRHERLYVICNTHPRHKQMSMKKKEKNTWILTSASQSPQRPW